MVHRANLAKLQALLSLRLVYDGKQFRAEVLSSVPLSIHTPVLTLVIPLELTLNNSVMLSDTIR